MTFIALVVLFSVCCAVSLTTCLFVRRFGPSIGLIDKPGARKIHSTPIPTGGGLGIWIGILFPFVLLTFLTLGLGDLTPEGTVSPESSTVWGVPLAKCPALFADHIGGVAHRLGRLWTLLGLGSLLVVLGTLDDRFNLDWKPRLAVEFVVAAVAVALGWRASLFLDLPILTGIISVFWIVGLVNSFNMLDNMDALSAGVATICALFLAVVALCFAPNPESGEPQLFLGGLLVATAGAAVGFLILNRPPAKMFMGDGGAYLLGFLLATSTLSIAFVDGDKTPKSAIFVPLCILAVPLYDTISVVSIRLRNGKSPFVGDNNHYSHRLVALGLSKPAAVATIYLTTAICASGALLLFRVETKLAVVVFAQTLLTLALVAVLEFAARKKIREEEAELREVRRKLDSASDTTSDATSENRSNGETDAKETNEAVRRDERQDARRNEKETVVKKSE